MTIDEVSRVIDGEVVVFVSLAMIATKRTGCVHGYDSTLHNYSGLSFGLSQRWQRCLQEGLASPRTNKWRSVFLWEDDKLTALVQKEVPVSVSEVRVGQTMHATEVLLAWMYCS